jgi:hypothetical protein
VSASALTPTRQSGSSACSAGECETPVGLRTNSIAVGIPAADRIPASWPAAVGMIGQSPLAWSAAIAVASAGSKATEPDTDSGVSATAVPSRSARSVACRAIVSTSSASVASLSHRASSHAVTREGTALVPLGVTSTRPNVARCPASRACLLAASAVIA